MNLIYFIFFVASYGESCPDFIGIEPVAKGSVDMCIGMRNRKIYYLRHIFAFVPLLGGERVITKDLWQNMPDYYKHGFRVEAGLNFFAHNYGKGFEYKIIRGLKQIVKEKKYGLLPGIKQKAIMFSDLINAQLKIILTKAKAEQLKFFHKNFKLAYRKSETEKS